MDPNYNAKTYPLHASINCNSASIDNRIDVNTYHVSCRRGLKLDLFTSVRELAWPDWVAMHASISDGRLYSYRQKVLSSSRSAHTHVWRQIQHIRGGAFRGSISFLFLFCWMKLNNRYVQVTVYYMMRLNRSFKVLSFVKGKPTVGAKPITGGPWLVVLNEIV